MDSLGSYIPSPGHTGWDLEGAHMRVWAVGLGIFDPCKKGSLVQALDMTLQRRIEGMNWGDIYSIEDADLAYDFLETRLKEALE